MRLPKKSTSNQWASGGYADFLDLLGALGKVRFGAQIPTYMRSKATKSKAHRIFKLTRIM